MMKIPIFRQGISGTCLAGKFVVTKATRPYFAPSRMVSSIALPKPVSIAILDDYLGISIPHFKNIPRSDASVTVFDTTLPAWTHSLTTASDHEALVNRLKPFHVISAMRERTPFPRALLERLPNLRLLHATGTQHSTFDLVAARQLGIIVATAPGRGRTDLPEEQRPHAKRDITKGGAHPTTQHAWALILALARNVAGDDASVKSGGWQTSLAVGLTGKTLGICGLGRLGSSTARIGVLAWGMRVLCWSENLTQDKADAKAREVGLPTEHENGVKTFQAVSKEEMFRHADVISVHYVLSPRSVGIIGEKELGMMKPGAMIVNTSRGPLISDDALFGALEEGRIRGAALDVFDIEPLPTESRWRTTPWGKDRRSQVLLTPHMGYVEEEIMHTWYDETAENVERWMRGDEVLNRLN